MASKSRIFIEVPAGELIDKITILEIKEEKFKDFDKLEHVRAELVEVRKVFNNVFDDNYDVFTAEDFAEIKKLMSELKLVNRELWEIQDRIWQSEHAKKFDEHFISLARSIYLKKAYRAVMKRQLNRLFSSRLIEEKNFETGDAAYQRSF